MMNADGSGQRKLADGPWNMTSSLRVWSPDGKRHRLRRDDCLRALLLLRSRALGRATGRERVTEGRPECETAMAALCGRRTGRACSFGQILNPYGESRTRSSCSGPGRRGDWTLGGGGRPLSTFEDWSWSPDGRRIAYMASDGDTTDAYVEGARGRGKRLLAHFVYGVQWSPAGGEIAVIKRFGKKTVRLATVPVRGGLPHKIASADYFAWDRRGRRLASFPTACIRVSVSRATVATSGSARRRPGSPESLRAARRPRSRALVLVPRTVDGSSTPRRSPLATPRARRGRRRPRPGRLPRRSPP